MGGIPTPGAARAVAGVVQRRPKDMTDAELEALPVGPFVKHRREVTPEERARGIHGRWIEWEECRAMRATAWGLDDIFGWRDREGRLWDFGQWADGSWFKQRSILA